MERLQVMIDKLSKSADDADLISLHATSREARLYNADLARQLRDVVGALQNELDRRDGRAFAERCGLHSPPLI
jgi:hypothetical protein